VEGSVLVPHLPETSFVLHAVTAAPLTLTQVEEAVIIGPARFRISHNDDNNWTRRWQKTKITISSGSLDNPKHKPACISPALTIRPGAGSKPAEANVQHLIPSSRLILTFESRARFRSEPTDRASWDSQECTNIRVLTLFATSAGDIRRFVAALEFHDFDMENKDGSLNSETCIMMCPMTFLRHLV
jgi:hypothetical protein